MHASTEEPGTTSMWLGVLSLRDEDFNPHVAAATAQGERMVSVWEIVSEVCRRAGARVVREGNLPRKSAHLACQDLKGLAEEGDIFMIGPDHTRLFSPFQLPVWIASLLHAAKCLRSDCARRKKFYRLLQRKLMFHGVGVMEENLCLPTYVYPEEVKMLARSVFSENICEYPDPCHDKVVYVTVEDLHEVQNN